MDTGEPSDIQLLLISLPISDSYQIADGYWIAL
jgi:hypothetical protein